MVERIGFGDVRLREREVCVNDCGSFPAKVSFTFAPTGLTCSRPSVAVELGDGLSQTRTSFACRHLSASGAMSNEILNCEWTFTSQCPRTWESLRATDDDAVRLCEVCLKNVYLCVTMGDVERHAELRHCVAIRTADAADFGGGELLGELCEE